MVHPHVRAAAAFHALHHRHVVAAVAHVGHGQDRASIQCRHGRFEARPWRQRRARVAAAIHRLREDRVRLLFVGRHHHVEGFGNADAEFLDRHRMHGLSIGGHHGHAQAGNAHVEEGHRRTVDEAQPHLLAALEQARPVACGRGAVDQVGVGEGSDVGQVGRAHPHPAPCLAVGQCRIPSVAARIAQEVADGALVQVVVVGLDAQFAHDRVRILVAPVGQQDDVIAVRGDRIGVARLDHDRTEQAARFLQAGMGVIPVGPGLAHVEAVHESLAGLDAVETETGHAIHVRGQQDAVPVQRRVLAQMVGDAQRHGVAFAPAQGRCGQGSVRSDRDGCAAGEIDRSRADGEVEFAAAQFDRIHAGLRVSTRLQ